MYDIDRSNNDSTSATDKFEQLMVQTMLVKFVAYPSYVSVVFTFCTHSLIVSVSGTCLCRKRFTVSVAKHRRHLANQTETHDA